MEGCVDRVRPKMMTVTAIIAGLLPILWGDGAGASVMKRIAAPMVGGMISSAILTLVVIPAVYFIWKERELPAGVHPGGPFQHAPLKVPPQTVSGGVRHGV
jgi:copper/silver efflux system protein